MPDTLREKLDKLLEGIPGYADAILAIFASELVKAQREAFVTGAKWQSYGLGDGFRMMDEASRRYPNA